MVLIGCAYLCIAFLYGWGSALSISNVILHCTEMYESTCIALLFILISDPIIQ